MTFRNRTTYNGYGIDYFRAAFITEEYRQGDEFKTGILSAGARRFKLEGKRQGREAYAAAGEEETASGHADREDGFGRFIILATAEDQARTLSRISEAESAAAEALIEARQREQEAREHLDRLRENATKTADGRTVFLSADGTRAVDDQGRELTAEELGAIDWREGATTLEHWQQAIETREQAIRDVQEIEAYQERLKEGREQIESGGGLTASELKAIEDDLAAMPGSVREHPGGVREPAKRASAAKEYGEGQGIQADAVTPAFARAVAANPEEIATMARIPAAAPKPLDI